MFGSLSRMVSPSGGDAAKLKRSAVEFGLGIRSADFDQLQFNHSAVQKFRRAKVSRSSNPAFPWPGTG
jgi:hypothetical protein